MFKCPCNLDQEKNKKLYRERRRESTNPETVSETTNTFLDTCLFYIHSQSQRTEQDWIGPLDGSVNFSRR